MAAMMPAVGSFGEDRAKDSTLRARIAQALDAEPLTDRPEITNVRHIALVQRAHDALARARSGARRRRIALGRIRARRLAGRARGARGDRGRRAPEDLLAHIFARFCVGK